MAEAQRHGLRHTLDPPDDLLDRYHAGATQTDLAAHYGVATSTVVLWLQAHGITRRRGRRPIDADLGIPRPRAPTFRAQVDSVSSLVPRQSRRTSTKSDS